MSLDMRFRELKTLGNPMNRGSPSLLALDLCSEGRGPFGLAGEVDGEDLESVEHVQGPPDVFGIGIADDDTVQSFNAPAPEEVDQFGPARDFPVSSSNSCRRIVRAPRRPALRL